MKAALPGLRSKLSSNPEYFKKVYMHTFDLCKQPGGRVMAIDTALSLWPVFVLPNLTQPALSRVSAGESPTGPATSTPAAFQEPEFELWLEFMTKKNKAVSKDTWSLFIDFVRTIDADAKEYDEEGELANAVPKLTVQPRGRPRLTSLSSLCGRRGVRYWGRVEDGGAWQQGGRTASSASHQYPCMCIARQQCFENVCVDPELY
jgi:DCN1-like protein 1/2